MNRYVFAAAAAALSTAAVMSAPHAFASDMKLSWGDLDLSTKAGQTELSHRIDRVAIQMCGDQSQTGSNIDNTQRCRSDVRAKLSQQVAQTNQRIAMGN